MRNGTTLHHITDSHFGASAHATFLNNWHDRTGYDLAYLKVAHNAGHVHTGDMIHMYPGGTGATVTTEAQEEGWYKAWRDKIKAVDGKPFAEAVGNHDLLGYGPGNVGRTGRYATEWAASMGLKSKNNAYDFGEVKVLTIGPDRWDYGSNFVLSGTTLIWLNSQLQTAGKPCWIAAHVPWSEQIGDGANGTATINLGNPTLEDIIASNPNAIGWLSGHLHSNINTDAHAEVFTVGGRKLFGVNGPAAGGGLVGADDPTDDTKQFAVKNTSMFITYLGDSIDVRWRNHHTESWTNPTGETVRHIPLT